MAPAPGQPVQSHMPRELSETGHAIVRSRTVTVFCRYHDNYISVVTSADQSGTEVASRARRFFTGGSGRGEVREKYAW